MRAEHLVERLSTIYRIGTKLVSMFVTAVSDRELVPMRPGNPRSTARGLLWSMPTSARDPRLASWSRHPDLPRPRAVARQRRGPACFASRRFAIESRRPRRPMCDLTLLDLTIAHVPILLARIARRRARSSGRFEE